MSNAVLSGMQYVSQKKDAAFALLAAFETSYEQLAAAPDADLLVTARDELIRALNALEDAASVACGFWGELSGFVRTRFSGDFKNHYLPLITAYGQIRRLCANGAATLTPPPDNFLEQWQQLLTIATPEVVQEFRARTLEEGLPAVGFNSSHGQMQEVATVPKSAAKGKPTKKPAPPRPRLFIGSSTESLDVANAIQANLDFNCEAKIWTQGVFGAGQDALDALVEAANGFDFAVLVLSKDDVTTSRGKRRGSPRDNVIFELGLFMGVIGRNRVFFVHDRTTALKIPSDLSGVTALHYAPHSDGSTRSALGAACTELAASMKKLGLRTGR